MKKLIMLTFLIIPFLSNAAWVTKVEESIFDEKNALLIGEISGDQSFMVFECKGSDLYLSYIEMSSEPNVKSRPVTMLFKVDNNPPIELHASFQRRNPNYVEAVSQDTGSILNALNQLKSAKTKYMSGLTVKGTDFRVSFSGDVYRSTVGVNSFMDACGLNGYNTQNPVRNVKKLDCSESLKKSNKGRLIGIVTNRALLEESVCYNGVDVTQKISNLMGVKGDVGKNLRVRSWSDNKSNKLYVSFFNEDTGDINLDIAYLDKDKKIKSTKNYLIPKNDLPERWPETAFSFIGESKGSDNSRWLYFNVIEATNLYSYRLKLNDEFSQNEKPEIEFFSYGGVYKIWGNGNVSVETSWMDDSKGRMLGGVIKNPAGKQVCELETNDQETPVDRQKCK